MLAPSSSDGASRLSRASFSILLIVCMRICAVSSVDAVGQQTQTTNNEGEKSSMTSNEEPIALMNPRLDSKGKESQVPSSLALRNEFGGRSLLDSTDVCHICASVSKLRNDTLPNLGSGTSSSSGGGENNESSLPSITRSAPFPDEMTCEEWESYAVPLSADSSDCFDLRNLLLRRCCNDLPPMYECQTRARHQALRLSKSDGVSGSGSGFGAIYDSSVPPIPDEEGTGNDAAIEVSVVLNVSSLSMVTHDIFGGVIEVVGTIGMTWVDDRLRWDGASLGCTSATFAASAEDLPPDYTEIWVPALRHVSAADHDGGSSSTAEEVPPPSPLRKSRAKVLANGTVSWERRGTFTGRCEATDAYALDKRCSVEFVDDAGVGESGVRYALRIVGAENMSLRGYVLDEASMGTSSVRTTSEEAFPTAEFRFHFHQVASVYNCSLCGDVGGTILADKYPRESLWMEPYVPNQSGWSCGEREAARASRSNNGLCLWSQAFFMDQCCTDPPRVRHECGIAVRKEKIEGQGYDIAVPPTKKESSRFYKATGDDSVDVNVNLDVSHVLHVDIKKSTMQLLVSVELTWLDERLTWDPSSSGCYRASFRATDDHTSEIWVPEIELVNMVESTQSLPKSFASVYFSGLVWWKRTGIIEATCDLTGITKFPFDTLGCYIEFGSTRDPSFHRVNYLPGGVEYGRRFHGDAKHYQEYKLNTNQTEVTRQTEDLSGFSNDLVRFQFYFARATRFYVKMFVLLYLFFTYLSFGMFLLGQDTGTRLGYGTSMLFVIVAQDITMAGMTPVTQEKLWIYEFSFGSKMFVLIGIVQTLAVAYFFRQNDFEDDGTPRSSEITTKVDLESVDDHETEGLMNGGGDRISSTCDDKSRNSENDDQSQKVTETEQSPPQAVDDSSILRSKNVSRRPKFLLWAKRKILKYEIKQTDSKNTKKSKKHRIVDRVFFFAFMTSYSIFVGVMLGQVL